MKSLRIIIIFLFKNISYLNSDLLTKTLRLVSELLSIKTKPTTLVLQSDFLEQASSIVFRSCEVITLKSN